jgi:hypothetical protein
VACHLSRALIHLALERFSADARRDSLSDYRLLPIRVAGTEEDCWIPNASLGGHIFRDQFLKDPHLTHFWVRAVAYKITDLRWSILSVTVNAPVPLLKP